MYISATKLLLLFACVFSNDVSLLSLTVTVQQSSSFVFVDHNHKLTGLMNIDLNVIVNVGVQTVFRLLIDF